MESSLSLLEKHDEILANEQKLAGHVALDVIDRPVLAMWMILIPIFFVFYYFQLRRYKNGIRDFIDNFLITRKRVLAATYNSLYSDEKIDVDELVAVSDSPDETKEDYRVWIEALIEYYQVLLRAKGNSFEELIKASHNSRTNYLLSLNKLNTVEQAFNASLDSALGDEEGTVAAVIKAMEKSVESFRRDQAKEIFT